nr:hypothetical protein [Tanacetum cinerariifolium]
MNCGWFKNRTKSVQVIDSILLSCTISSMVFFDLLIMVIPISTVQCSVTENAVCLTSMATIAPATTTSTATITASSAIVCSLTVVQPDVETPYPFATRPMESDANSGGYKADVSTGIPQQKKGSFASLLRPKVVINKLNFRTFVTDEKVESYDCVLPKAAANKGRISFARALIEISSDSTLNEEVIMAIPEEEGDRHIKEVIRVVYEWKPSHCVECKCFGHGPNSCPKRVKEDRHVGVNKPSNTKNNGEGFVEVKSQKNKGKDISCSIGGGSNVASTSGDTKEGNNKVSSLTRAKSYWTTSNTFEALNVVDEDVQDPSMQNCSKLDGEKCQEEDSLWLKFQKSKNDSSHIQEDESDEDEVYEAQDYNLSGKSQTFCNN